MGTYFETVNKYEKAQPAPRSFDPLWRPWIRRAFKLLRDDAVIRLEKGHGHYALPRRGTAFENVFETLDKTGQCLDLHLYAAALGAQIVESLLQGVMIARNAVNMVVLLPPFQQLLQGELETLPVAVGGHVTGYRDDTGVKLI